MMEDVTEPAILQQAHETADAVARRSYGKLVAYLAARTHDVASAEDALAAAFAAALALSFVTAFLACWIPARRAAALNPLDGLRT